jgi:hypothetical protein
MSTRTKEDWQALMELHAAYSGTIKQFCLEHNIPQQSFYARRHTMGLSKPSTSKRTTRVVKNEARFIKAQLPAPASTIVLQTHHAQLSLSTQCDPLWLAALLKGLAV